MPETYPPEVLARPEDPVWVSHLRVGDTIRLCKEFRYGRVWRTWVPPEPGHVAGQLDIEIDRRVQRWYVYGNGTGFDGLQLILPCKRHYAPVAVPPYEDIKASLPESRRAIIRR